MAFADRSFTCRECGSAFVWTSGEQEFYQLKGLLHEPQRCPDCRQKAKAVQPIQSRDISNRRRMILLLLGEKAGMRENVPQTIFQKLSAGDTTGTNTSVRLAV